MVQLITPLSSVRSEYVGQRAFYWA